MINTAFDLASEVLSVIKACGSSVDEKTLMSQLPASVNKD
jgi:hypothetical protein